MITALFVFSSPALILLTVLAVTIMCIIGGQK